MNVKNIVKNTAKILELNEVMSALDSEDVAIPAEVMSDINNLVLAVNMTNNNIASNYLELVDSVELNNNNGVVLYSNITNKNIIEIKSVKDSAGNNIDFRNVATGIKTKSGKIVVEYSYFPDAVTLENEINYYLKLNELLFSLGVAGEYLFIKGDIDNAYIWDKRFKQNMFSLLRPKRNVNMPQRRWY